MNQSVPGSESETAVTDPRWHCLLPSRLRNQFSQRPLLRRIVANITWLIGDKILRLGVGVWIGAWVARHLGPEQFGKLNYSMAIIALFSAFATVGLPDVLIRDLVRTPQHRATIFARAFAMRIAGSVVVLVLAMALAADAQPGNTHALLLFAVFAVWPLAQTTDVID